MRRWLATLRVVTVLAVLASVAVAGGQAAWHIAGQASDQPIPIAPLAAAPPDAVAIDVAPLLALAPFGRQSQPEAPQAVIEETDLDLELRGILLNDRPELSFAFIASDGVTRGYNTGEPISETVTLQTIEAEHVTLDVGGETQSLYFPNHEEPLATAEADAAPSGLDRLRAALTVADARPEAEEPTPETTEDYINMWRERINRNPTDVLKEIGLTASDNGYIIGQEHDPGVRMAGLKAGDVVASVNGQPVGNVETDRKRYDEVAASGVARLEIIRDGKTITMSFPLR